jgi:tetratricopeptide (TPR) repeat protein
MKLKLPLFLLASLFYCSVVYSHPENDSLLNELNKTINNTKLYDGKKREDIAVIKNSFNDSQNSSLPLKYEFYQKLYEEYKYFRFDTAYIYALKMQQTAFALGDPSRITESNINLFFVLVSAGMFNEASDLIRKINITGQADRVKANYFSLKARYYFDLADYVHDEFHSPRYNENAKDNLDSALSLFPANSFESLYYRGLKNLKNDSFGRAFDDFQTLLKRPELTHHQVALVTSTLSYIYRMRGEKNTAIQYQMRAAIADIKSSTKETYAILNLSKLLFEEGDFKNASFFIEKAIDDATFYGARQRKVQVSTIMPIIQSSRINLIEGQRR